jgi:hypothetical protein
MTADEAVSFVIDERSSSLSLAPGAGHERGASYQFPVPLQVCVEAIVNALDLMSRVLYDAHLASL